MKLKIRNSAHTVLSYEFDHLVKLLSNLYKYLASSIYFAEFTQRISLCSKRPIHGTKRHDYLSWFCLVPKEFGLDSKKKQYKARWRIKHLSRLSASFLHFLPWVLSLFCRAQILYYACCLKDCLRLALQTSLRNGLMTCL